MGCLELPADRHCPGTRRGTLGRYAGQEAVIPYWSYHFYDQFAVVRTCALSLLSHWLSSTPRARRCIFLVNIPIGIFASFIVARVVPSSARSGANQRFDWLGTLVIILALTCFGLGMTEGMNRGFGSGIALTLLAVAAIALVCFLAIEARIEHPSLNLSIFRNLQFSLSLLMGV